MRGSPLARLAGTAGLRLRLLFRALLLAADEVNVILPAEGLEIEQVIGWVSLTAGQPVRVT